MTRPQYETKTALDSSGNTIGNVKLYDAVNNPLKVAYQLGDSDNGGNALAIDGYVFNGSSWDRVRNNTQGVLLASAARTATATSPTQTNHNAKGVQVSLKITTASATGSLQINIEGFGNGNTNNGYWVAQSPNIAGGTGIEGTYTFELYPGVTSSGTFSKNGIPAKQNGTLPRTWGVSIYTGDSSSWTYELDYALIN